MNWRRLFGLLLTEFFTSSPFKVELETVGQPRLPDPFLHDATTYRFGTSAPAT
jgi:hypothetical protein